MSTYKELIKNFEKIRSYMRDFYVYGFKNRDEYTNKSARSYDDEKRRAESILGEHMKFTRTKEGKNVFISIDSRSISSNPLYKALKAKSFTDGDITLHFLIFDILHDANEKKTLNEIIDIIENDCLSMFSSPMEFDESTVRKKLKEYISLGIVTSEKAGKNTLYGRAEDAILPDLRDALDFFSEVSPCGVIGSFLLDKSECTAKNFLFKHHYITSAIDSDVLADLFLAMRKKCMISAKNHSRRFEKPNVITVLPLRVFISTQNGRQYLVAYDTKYKIIKSYRVDYLSDIKMGDEYTEFDDIRSGLDEMQKYIWGVSLNRSKHSENDTEHVEFTVRVEDNEQYIVRRLYREKRVGEIEKLDENTYKFSADIYDSGEIITWIRTFICRITEINFSNKAVEQTFRNDLEDMYKMYGVKEDNDDIQ